MTTYRGKVENGKIVFDGPNPLPEGTRVLVTPDAAQATRTPNGSGGVDPVYRLGDDAVDGGIPDLSAEHDHYIYGTPKRGPRKD